MSDWPDALKVAPIREWPGEMTQSRRTSPFRGTREVNGKRRSNVDVPLTQTLGDLDRELREIRAKEPELLVAIAPEKFRIDGRPRAGATPVHPGVILSFEIPNVGRVSYPCDTFTTWEANLRGIVLALEALRKVNRYGVVKHGEQYRGFLALEAAEAGEFPTYVNALTWLIGLVGWNPQDRPDGGSAADYAAGRRELIRRAKRMTHPDMGGDPATFQRVSLAEAKLREAGIL